MHARMTTGFCVLLATMCISCGWKKVSSYYWQQPDNLGVTISASISADSVPADTLFDIDWGGGFSIHYGPNRNRPPIYIKVTVSSCCERLFVPVRNANLRFAEHLSGGELALLIAHVTKDGKPIEDELLKFGVANLDKYAKYDDLPPACAGYESHLQLMLPGETAVLADSVDVALLLLKTRTLHPVGTYRIVIELRGECVRGAGPPIWTGRVFSDTLNFVVTE